MNKAVFTIGMTWSIMTSSLTAYTAYVTNSADDTVSVIDTLTNTPSSPLTAGDFPAGISTSFDGNFAVFVNTTAGTANKIFIATNSVGPTMPAGTDPTRVAITPSGLFAYITNNSQNKVSILDLTSETIVGTVNVGSSPIGIAITPDGTRAYVANSGSNNVSVIALSTNTVIDTIALGAAPNDIAITPDGSRAYVGNRVIYLSDNSTAPLPVTVFALAIGASGNTVYLVSPFSTNLTLLDTATNTISQTIPLGGIGSFGVGVTADEKWAYVVNNGMPLTAVVDLTAGAVTTTVATGNDSIAITLSFVQTPPQFTGKRKSNKAGIVSEQFNSLTWERSATTTLAGYYLSRNGTRIATLGADQTSFKDHNRPRSQTDTYSLIAFDIYGNASGASLLTIEGN